MRRGWRKQISGCGFQNPIRLAEHSEPQPDAALFRPCPDFYAETHPGPEEALLVIEVQDIRTLRRGEALTPLLGPELSLTVDAILG